MGFFKRKDKIVDLTAQYKKDQEKIANIKEEQESATSTGLGFFGAIAKTAASDTASETIELSETEEKKRKLIKRLTDMTEKLENLSNQIYHLEQRIEVVERKMDVNRI